MRNKRDTRRKRTPALPVSFFSSFTAVGLRPQSILGIRSKAIGLDLLFMANILGINGKRETYETGADTSAEHICSYFRGIYTYNSFWLL